MGDGSYVHNLLPFHVSCVVPTLVLLLLGLKMKDGAQRWCKYGSLLVKAFLLFLTASVLFRGSNAFDSWLARPIAPSSTIGSRRTFLGAKKKIDEGDALGYQRRGGSFKYNYTLQYSYNFRRHVVRDGKQRVVRSFLWLDEALESFPDARMLPLELLPPQLIITNRTLLVAGAGGFPDYSSDNMRGEQTSYPPAAATVDDSNEQKIRIILETVLKWFPSQVQELVKQWPAIASYPPHELHERIEFLLAPVPNSTILDKVNYTDDIDWPLLFHNDHCGAGMSVAQVSHALQIVPQYVLRLPQLPSLQIGWEPQLLILYEQTPSVVLEMAHSKLGDAWLAGTTTVETALFAYLHWKGWEWTQCRIILHACPCLLQPALEVVGHEHGLRKLMPESLTYLHARLQLRPWHLQAMFKTHTRLTGYRVEQLERNMNWLQHSLRLSYSQLQAVVLEMPSLLGASVDSLHERLAFWTRQVGLSVRQLQSAVLEKPALLQYSVEANLEPKLSFFRDELGIEAGPLIQLTASHPDLWAYSLERKLRSMCSGFLLKCSSMTANDFGQMILKAPELVRCNWKTNLSVKLDFLQTKLDLSPEMLTSMVKSTPRILLHSTKSLETKIQLLEQAGCRTEGYSVLQEKPSLLLASVNVLKRRIERVLEMGWETSLSDVLATQSRGQGSRSRKTVSLLTTEGDSIEVTFGGVVEAARHAGTSVSVMYKALRNDRLLHGRKYAYSGTTQPAKINLSPPVVEIANESEAMNDDAGTRQLTILVSGVAFPPEAGVRGRRRSGGMALQIPTWSIENWREPCSTIWKGQKLRLLPDGRTAILGYSYTRPSRPRCSLYACREAIRVATQWVRSVRAPSANIEIVTDSSYVLDLLENTTQVLEWGSAKTRKEFCYTGSGPLYKANPDILYPVARSLYHLVHQDNLPSKEKKNVAVRFTHTERSGSYRRTVDGAKLAAKLMYERSH